MWMLYIWFGAIEAPVIVRPAGASASHDARVPAETVFGPGAIVIPGGMFVPGGQYIDVLMPKTAWCQNTFAPHVVTVRLPAANAVADDTLIAAGTAATATATRIHAEQSMTGRSFAPTICLRSKPAIAYLLYRLAAATAMGGERRSWTV